MGGGTVLGPISLWRPTNPALHDALALRQDQVAIAGDFWSAIETLDADLESDVATGLRETLQFRPAATSPLPPPRLLAQYNDAVDEGAERLVRLTETEAQHRRMLEARTQIFTFTIALISLLGGIVLIAFGNNVEGLVALVTAIAGLGGVFVVKSLFAQKSERALIKR
jgi:uncharacterized membrane protein